MELNATYLFELTKESGHEFLLPPSESFWTTTFTLFILQHGEHIRSIPAWRYQTERPYFTPCENLALDLQGLRASDIAVEPSAVSHMNYLARIANDCSEEAARWAGFRPDLLVRRPLSKGVFKYSFVEVKTGCIAAANQIENYPRLISRLESLHIPSELFFLCSVGGRSYTSILSLQQLDELAGKFGVLLWEDVFRKMADVDFQPFGDKIDWRKYSEDAFSSHCQLLKAGAVG